MPSGERIYHNSVRAFSLIFIAIGLVLLTLTFANGGGPVSTGVLLGIAFLAVGVVRGWLGGSFRGWRGGRGAEDAPVRKPPSPRDRTRGRAPS